jgi:hypothetical protein
MVLVSLHSSRWQQEARSPPTCPDALQSGPALEDISEVLVTPSREPGGELHHLSNRLGPASDQLEAQ